MTTTASDLENQLRAGCADTPYTVSQMPGGLLVHLDVADLAWMTLLRQNGLQKEYSIELALDEANHVYREEQVIRSVSWTAGLAAGTFGPQVSASRSMQRGTMVEVSSSSMLGMDRSGHVGMVGYAFDSRPMAKVVNDVMGTSGWTKKMGRSARIGLTVAIACVGGVILAGLIVLFILLALN
jgi:hypothetical protein